MHAGLRYLRAGQLELIEASAVERHRLLTTIAPHLTRPIRQLVPLHAPGAARTAAIIFASYAVGDVFRHRAGTPRSALPSPGFLSARTVTGLAPAVRRAGLRGGVFGWEGQLIDDARLVIAVARTAAGFGARILTKIEAAEVSGDGALLRDLHGGGAFRLSARVVLNATGVWAPELVPDLRVRPSRGTHLVVRRESLGITEVALTVPVPGHVGRLVYALPAPERRMYIGVTDVDAPGPISAIPVPSSAEVNELLTTLNGALETPLHPRDVIGSFAGLRPLVDVTAGGTADASRSHVVAESSDGVISVVGGKLTTYRRMAQDGVDAAIRLRGLAAAGRCRTASIPLVGAAPRPRLAEIRALPRLIRRFGSEAPLVAEHRTALAPPEPLRLTGQELSWGVDVEGAMTVDDLLDRRTRVGLVDSDRALATEAAAAAFDR